MPRVVIIYDSRTGNTEKMANAVADGARSVDGVDVVLVKVSPLVGFRVKIMDLEEAHGIILGSPTHYRTITSRFSTLLDKVVGSSLKGKVGGAFGSYLWEGEAMVDLNRAMIGSGMELISEGVRVKGAPSADDLTQCYMLGKVVALRVAAKG